MIFVRDKGQMCNNILQYAHVYAWARENQLPCMSMRFAYKYQFFQICTTKYHNFWVYLWAKYASKLKLLPVITYDLSEEGKTEKEQFILNHRNVVVEGWGVRYYDLFLKYKQEILQLFTFKEDIQRKVESLIASTGSDTIKIGVHIRRGDYKTFFGGRYFFDDNEFLHYIHQAIALCPNRKYTVYICGNDPKLDRTLYMEKLPEANVVFPDGSAGEDLCLLSECDYLLGPPSSFSLIATMYGKARLHWMTNNSAIRSLEDFKEFDTLFRFFDDFWI